MAKQQADAQRAVPMSASPSISPEVLRNAAQKPPVAAPGTLPHLEPTNRPNEPVTAGLPFGPGAGVEATEANYPSMAQILQNLTNNSHVSTLGIELSNTARSLGF